MNTDSSRIVLSNLALTFFIGFTAGAAPFAFIQLLPELLNPGVPFGIPNYWAIILVGVLVGIITSIIYATTYKASDSQSVFFHALGVPAILIATISNLSTEFSAQTAISEVKEIASHNVETKVPVEPLSNKPEQLSPPPEPLGQSSFISNTASAAENSKDVTLMIAQAGYLLVIGEYTNRESAWAAYREYKETRLRTERYTPKTLGVYEIESGRYVLAYNRYSTQVDAERAYRLLRINDPAIDARLLTY